MNLTVAKGSIGNTFLRHFIIWIVWLSVNSLNLLEIWSQVPKLPLVYNYLSLVMLYYPVYFCAKGYWNTVAGFYSEGINGWSKFKYLLLRWQVALIVLFIFTYIIGSWFIDRYCFNIIYNDFFMYCGGRWIRASTYVLVAVGYSYFRYYSAKQKMKQKAADVKIILLKDYIARNHVKQVDTLNELISRVDRVTGA